VVRKWLLPTLSEILAKAEPTGIDLEVPEPRPVEVSLRPEIDRAAHQAAELQWDTALTALTDLLLKVLPTDTPPTSTTAEQTIEGLLITAPLPLFSDRTIVSQFQTVTFNNTAPNFQLPPSDYQPSSEIPNPQSLAISLLPTDPLAEEKFCVVFTNYFSLVLVWGEERGIPRCQFSFNPEDIEVVWKSLRGRIVLTSPHQLQHLDSLVEQFTPIAPNYRWVMAFSQQLLQHLPNTPTAAALDQSMATTSVEKVSPKSTVDLELLQALTHEIRTPLSTIRTMTRLILRQSDLSPRTLKRLESIDRECTEQINRMELIFSAVELATTQPQTIDLTTMSIDSLLEHSLPLWQQQAERRNLDLAVDIPHTLPAVVSNPTILDRVLTGLVENFTRNLPAGSRIQVEVTPVGDRLKLQLQSQSEAEEPVCAAPRLSIGQLLTFQPETGNLSLNMNVTKNLFHILGGKLIVRQHREQGEILTIFLPLSTF
jgi:His Kinase A (phospho-acceptor) domain